MEGSPSDHISQPFVEATSMPLPSLNMGPNIYFIFTLVMVVITAVANGPSQNAAFAFATGFGRTEYAPAIMTRRVLVVVNERGFRVCLAPKSSAMQ
jgi:hypothetical protein